MKVAAGGLQVQTVHDEATNRQAQESRRTDYQQKPVNVSDNTAALNRSALNKTVEKPNDAGDSFDLPLRLRDNEKERSRGFAGNKDDKGNANSNSGSKETDEDEPGRPRGFNLDKYI
ncbi:MAG: hypothetical protein VR67_16345 [Peptococcaceae bacterium BRH_c8a]|nr:MAG: hypothetical protein VR67_16345 [Peptococcaceae bacterium BRH_c8a]